MNDITNTASTVNTKKVKRHINGIFLLDKSKGLSSNKALQQVKHTFHAVKAGHTGALDPMATGLLPICLGEATKFSHYLLEADKGYETTIQLGIQTDTGDTEGITVSEVPVPELSELDIIKVLDSFIGEQKQIPPMYSALKKDGKKLYELAREGKTIDRPARLITIKKINLIDYSNSTLTISVVCSKGTYIRVLGEDIAQKLGTVGHLIMLRRTQTGNFLLEDALTIDKLEAFDLSDKDTYLLPTHASIDNLPRIQLTEEQTARVQLGQRLNVFEQTQHLFNDSILEDIEVLLFQSEVFLGLAKLQSTGRLQPKRIINL